MAPVAGVRPVSSPEERFLESGLLMFRRETVTGRSLGMANFALPETGVDEDGGKLENTEELSIAGEVGGISGPMCWSRLKDAISEEWPYARFVFIDACSKIGSCFPETLNGDGEFNLGGFPPPTEYDLLDESKIDDICPY